MIAKRKRGGHDEESDVSWSTTYEMLECCGCESVHLTSTTWCSEWGPDEEDVRRFPPAVSRRAPSWLHRLDPDRRALFEEVYAALHADSRRLVVMGARALLDIFIVEHVGDVGTFAQKLDRLETEGFIGSRNRNILEAALDAGHAASHRGHNPKPEEVNYVMDIVENLFGGSLLGSAAEALRKATPPWPARRAVARATGRS